MISEHVSSSIQCSDSILARMCPSYPVPSSALYSVIVAAETAMQNEIKGFLSACIAESDKPKDKRKNRYNAMHMDQSQLDVERGVFSLGISSLGRDGVGGRFSAAAGFSSRANIVELPSSKFFWFVQDLKIAFFSISELTTSITPWSTLRSICE